MKHIVTYLLVPCLALRSILSTWPATLAGTAKFTHMVNVLIVVNVYALGCRYELCISAPRTVFNCPLCYSLTEYSMIEYPSVSLHYAYVNWNLVTGADTKTTQN